MTRKARQEGRREGRQVVRRGSAPVDLADRLHSAAIHLLRQLRTADTASGISAPQLSALSVIVFRGPISVGDLASAEHVRAPTISRLVRELERRGLVTREVDARDARVQRLSATAAGRSLLAAGRARRVERLAAAIASLPERKQGALGTGVALIEELVSLGREDG